MGRIVSMTFFWDKRYDLNVPRGPFRSSYDWLNAGRSFIKKRKRGSPTHF
jgi:hypothetical protein